MHGFQGRDLRHTIRKIPGKTRNAGTDNQIHAGIRKEDLLMSVNYVALGKRIGYFRMQCGNITQEALASKINRSREFLAKIEKGTEHPSVATLVDIADALCISIDDLLIDSLHYSVSTSNTELHRLLLDCNETEQEIIIRTARELKATLVSLGI